MKKIEKLSFLAFSSVVFPIFSQSLEMTFVCTRIGKRGKLGACVEQAESGVGVDPSIYTRPRPPL